MRRAELKGKTRKRIKARDGRMIELTVVTILRDKADGSSYLVLSGG